MTIPIDVTTRYATTVPTLTDAFGFVMDRLDTLGGAPSIDIAPMWRYSDTEDGVLMFTVVVSGMVEEPANQPNSSE